MNLSASSPSPGLRPPSPRGRPRGRGPARALVLLPLGEGGRRPDEGKDHSLAALVEEPGRYGAAKTGGDAAPAHPGPSTNARDDTGAEVPQWALGAELLGSRSRWPRSRA